MATLYSDISIVQQLGFNEEQAKTPGAQAAIRYVKCQAGIEQNSVVQRLWQAVLHLFSRSKQDLACKFLCSTFNIKQEAAESQLKKVATFFYKIKESLFKIMAVEDLERHIHLIENIKAFDDPNSEQSKRLSKRVEAAAREKLRKSSAKEELGRIQQLGNGIEKRFKKSQPTTKGQYAKIVADAINDHIKQCLRLIRARRARTSISKERQEEIQKKEDEIIKSTNIELAVATTLAELDLNGLSKEALIQVFIGIAEKLAADILIDVRLPRAIEKETWLAKKEIANLKSSDKRVSYLKDKLAALKTAPIIFTNVNSNTGEVSGYAPIILDGESLRIRCSFPSVFPTQAWARKRLRREIHSKLLSKKGNRPESLQNCFEPSELKKLLLQIIQEERASLGFEPLAEDIAPSLLSQQSLKSVTEREFLNILASIVEKHVYPDHLLLEPVTAKVDRAAASHEALNGAWVGRRHLRSMSV